MVKQQQQQQKLIYLVPNSWHVYPNIGPEKTQKSSGQGAGCYILGTKVFKTVSMVSADRGVAPLRSPAV